MKRSMPKRNRSGDETVGRIFEAAEAAFIRQGYDGMSLRTIAGVASVNIGVLPYYWGHKQGLLSALCAARLGALIEVRRAAFEAFDDHEDATVPDIRAIIEAYVGPLFDPEMVGAGLLWGRLSCEGAPEAVTVREALITPLDQAFARRLRRACSHLDFEPFTARLKLLQASLSADISGSGHAQDTIEALSAMMRAPFKK